ncbi:MAG: type II secretion system major pseudopilin GspG [Gammaproteobacteria bacterium]|nr:type II secretion system major pseudopilin GspG [Gammaproteobacteria bacterium]
MKTRKQRGQHRIRGFTLLEILIVVLIIGLIVALVVPNLVGHPDQAKIKMAQAQMKSFDQALQVYYLSNSHYPSTDQGLQALVERPSGYPEPRSWGPKPYMKRIPLDPWGNDYVYSNENNEFVIYSLGADGEEGGDGVAEDINSNDI